MRHVVTTSSLVPTTFTNEEGVSLSIASVSSTGRRTKEVSYHTTKAVELRSEIARRNVLANKEALDKQRGVATGKPYECMEEIASNNPSEYQPIHQNNIEYPQDITHPEQKKKRVNYLSATYSTGMPRVKDIYYKESRGLYIIQISIPEGKLSGSSRDYNKAIEIRDALIAIKDSYTEAL